MAKNTKQPVRQKQKAFDIKWQNKYSFEEGFVCDIDTEGRHFINTFEKKEAKRFGTSLEAAKAVEALIAMGEGNNNTFSIEAI